MLSSFKNDLKICVIGASGGIGRCLLKKLDNDHSVKSIYTFSRKEISPISNKVKTFHIDITSEERGDSDGSYLEQPSTTQPNEEKMETTTNPTPIIKHTKENVLNALKTIEVLNAAIIYLGDLQTEDELASGSINKKDLVISKAQISI
mgnify:CR=1 FL=1